VIAPYSEYLYEVNRWEDPAKTFHSVAIDETTYGRLESAASLVVVDDFPIAVGIQDYGEQYSVRRSKAIGDGLLPHRDQPLYGALLPAAAVVSRSPSVREAVRRRGHHTSGFGIFGSYDSATVDAGALQSAAADAGLVAHRMIHPRLHTSAGLSLFELDLVARPRVVRRSPMGLREAFEALHHSDFGGDGSVWMRLGGGFGPEEEEGLWALFGTRFQDISENMPLRLEEDEQATLEVVRDERIVFISKSDADGRVVASLVVTDVEEAYPWISRDFLRSRRSCLAGSADADGLAEVFVPAIAALRGVSTRAAVELTAALGELLAGVGANRTIVRFECTDVSSAYVPQLVKRAVESHPSFDGAGLQQVGDREYVLLEFGGAES